MKQLEIKENTEKLMKFVSEKFEDNQLNNDSLVQLIELAGSYLNLQTISDYAKVNKNSYNGVKYHREIITLFNIKFVVDNK